MESAIAASRPDGPRVTKELTATTRSHHVRTRRELECKRCACNPPSSRFLGTHHHFQNRLALVRLDSRLQKQKFLGSLRSNCQVKALVKESASPGFKLKDVAEPRIREDEVLIRVRRGGVCGTDVHIYDRDAWAKDRGK